MIQTSITAGPIATAASVLGATAPTARPRAEEQKDSRVKMPKNFKNLQISTKSTAIFSIISLKQ
jgi:hypothetical protein